LKILLYRKKTQPSYKWPKQLRLPVTQNPYVSCNWQPIAVDQNSASLPTSTFKEKRSWGTFEFLDLAGAGEDGTRDLMTASLLLAQ